MSSSSEEFRAETLNLARQAYDSIVDVTAAEALAELRSKSAALTQALDEIERTAINGGVADTTEARKAQKAWHDALRKYGFL